MDTLTCRFMKGEENMGRIMLATSNSTDEEYGGTFEINEEYFQVAVFNSSSQMGNVTLSKSIENTDSIMFIVSEGTAMRATTIYPVLYFKNGIRCGIDFTISSSSREYLFLDFVNNTTVNLVGLSLGAGTNVYVVAHGIKPN